MALNFRPVEAINTAFQGSYGDPVCLRLVDYVVAYGLCCAGSSRPLYTEVVKYLVLKISWS